VKFILITIISILIGFIGLTSYELLVTHPNAPIQSLIQTVTKQSFNIANPPSDSVKGKILEMSGEIFWEGRIATTESQLISQIDIQQGESIRTGEQGILSVDFKNQALVKLSSKTKVDFIQTIPSNFVANIASGSAEFKKLSTVPVSIRARHLLINIKSGKISIGVDSESSLVNLSIIEGGITVAYNDLNLVSHLQELDAPQRISFDDDLRSFE
jgi:hypothetical protein